MCSYNFSIYCIPHLFVQLAARAGSKCVFNKFPTLSISPRLSPVFFPYMLAPNVYFQDVYVRTRNLVAWFTRFRSFRCAFLTQHVKLQLFHLLYPQPVCAIRSMLGQNAYSQVFLPLASPSPVSCVFPIHCGSNCVLSVCATCRFLDPQSSCMV